MKELVLNVLESKLEDFYELLIESYLIKEKHFGNFIETCSILNAKSGLCPSDCKFCAQSSMYRTGIKTYPLLSERELENFALYCIERGINRFSYVTSGISPNEEEIKAIGRVIEKIKAKYPNAKICASLGQLKKEDLKYLKSCGLDRYHHNIETSKEFYPRVSRVQSWESRVRTVLKAKEVGLSVCCGGIFGMGESAEDVYSMAKTLKDLDVDSIPVNFLHPIKGTPLEKANFLTPVKCLKILVALRLAMPNKEIRICGGREYNLRELQPLGLFPANALMVGNYLTTKGRSLEKDAQMIKDLGMESSLR